MNIDKETLANVAKVARLELSDEELELFVPQMHDILSHFSKIQQADTEGVKPSFQPVPLRNKMRKDVPHECISSEVALKNSQNNHDGYFKGPRAL